MLLCGVQLRRWIVLARDRVEGYGLEARH